ncbi:hypothetical protein N7490_004416 [Penicillium lividum]|nr:hypothetical protein N7490_004416 [Penicillium lividum]
MQFFLEQWRISRQRQKQIVTKHDYPDDVWPHERRYWYRESSEECDLDDGEPAVRRREHL